MSTVNRTISFSTQIYGDNQDAVLVDVYVNGVKTTTVTVQSGNNTYSFATDMDTAADNTISFSTADTDESVYIGGVTYGYTKREDGTYGPVTPTKVTADKQDSNAVISNGSSTSYLISAGLLTQSMNGISDTDGDGYATLTGTSQDDYILLGGYNADIAYSGQSDYLISGTAHGGAGNDLMFAGSSSSSTGMIYTNDSTSSYALYGDDGNDTLVGAIQGTGILDGGAGNDIIYDGNAAETMIGGAGKNTFVLGLSSIPTWTNSAYDEEAVRSGENVNTISYSVTNADGTKSYDSSVTRSDTIDMSAFVTASFTRDGDDLIITGISQVDGSDLAQESSYRVEYYFSNNPVSKLSYGGQDLRVQDVQQLINLYGSGTTLTSRFADTLYLNKIEAYNDITITGEINLREGNDTIYCGSGNNTVYGGLGNDTISNAKVAYGGGGNDTYVYDFSNDYSVNSATISENYGVDDKGDVLQINSISYDQLWFSKSGQDLVISEIGTDHAITIQNWYTSQKAHVEQIQVDGKVLSDTSVANLVNAMASMTAPASGQTTLTESYQTQLSAVLAANWK